MYLLVFMISCLCAVVMSSDKIIERIVLLQAIEDFKDCSPLCIPCGFALSQVGVAPVLRHFGFQLIEHSIK